MKNETEVLNNWESQPTIPLKALERTKHVLQLETIREIRGLVKKIQYIYPCASSMDLFTGGRSEIDNK